MYLINVIKINLSFSLEIQIPEYQLAHILEMKQTFCVSSGKNCKCATRDGNSDREKFPRFLIFAISLRCRNPSIQFLYESGKGWGIRNCGHSFDPMRLTIAVSDVYLRLAPNLEMTRKYRGLKWKMRRWKKMPFRALVLHWQKIGRYNRERKIKSDLLQSAMFY